MLFEPVMPWLRQAILDAERIFERISSDEDGRWKEVSHSVLDEEIRGEKAKAVSVYFGD